MKEPKEPKRFWSKVAVGEPDECWEWLAQKTGQGYGRFGIPTGKNQPWKIRPAHRVSWFLTFGPIPEGLYVCHHCDNRGCVNPYHLFLGTHKDNQVDAAKKGRMAKGEDNGKSKLTEEEVLEIREMYSEGDWTQQEIADAFDVSNATIYKILKGKTWAWLV